MVVSFSVSYRAAWGESVWLNISEGCGELRLHRMICTDGERWVIDLDMPTSITHIEYMYELRNDEQLITSGWGKRRVLELDRAFNKYTLRDTWQVVPDNKILFSLPFTNTFFCRADKAAPKYKFKQAITIKIFAPAVQPYQQLYIVGSSKVLGEWKLDKALPMNGSRFPEWCITLDAERAMTNGDQYKFVVMDGDRAVEWEGGDNRVWHRSAFEPKEHRVYSGLHFRGGNIHWKGSGVAIPIFSLRSKDSCGIGDFDDLRKIADWAVAARQRVIQILPINDTTQNETWQDSYPYSTISTFALHPFYLSLDKMGVLEDKELAAEIKKEGKRLNKLPKLDYEGVGRLKWKFFRALYAQCGKHTMETKEYKDFFNANKDWLVPYAIFCHLRDVNGTADFSTWGAERQYQSKAVHLLSNPSCKDWHKIAVYLYLQFHLDKQLRSAVAYCHSKGVVLKGDIPIGISRYSVEAWSEPHLFNMDGQAGAPPDAFSSTGQNWGFPTYNWEVMARDGYAWWRRRFEKMADYFDLYRIDHILGFFRIWEIPTNAVHSPLGHFSPALPMDYDELAKWGLPMDKDRMCKPFIRHDFLEELFGDYVKEGLKFLDDKGYGIYDLKDKYNTQRKIQKHFEGKSDIKSIKLRDALYTLAADVLFIEDTHRQGTFHPRVAMHFTKSYQWMNDWEKERLNAIYTHYFYKRHNDFWAAMAMEKLPVLIDSTDMLCCAEDLGMVPECVNRVLHELGIITLEIQRMPKEQYAEFADTGRYPYLSVCTTSTHDMSTTREWWEEDECRTQRYYHQILGWYGDAPETASGQVCQNIIGNHLLSPSMLTILPMQEWLSIDETLRAEEPDSERINDPSNPNHYWNYRMHMNIEELVKATDFNNLVAEMTIGSGRW